MEALIIDGAMGEGGGQILRTSLSLSLLTGRTVVLNNIRANRNKPGILRQHLACVRAAQVISEADVSGAELGSTSLRFTPRDIHGGEFTFDVGSAGSSVLVCQTILLPLLLRAKTESQITFIGGTHNPLAPSLSFLQGSLFPLLRSIGAKLDVGVETWGFMPAGGGRWTLDIKPSILGEIHLSQRPQITGQRLVTSFSGIRRSVAERGHSEYKTLGLAIDDYAYSFEESPCPGIVMSHYIDFENYSLVVECLGRNRLPVERVAQLVAKKAGSLLDGTSAACEFLEDQLLLPLVILGGELLVRHETSHTVTNFELINQWLPGSLVREKVTGEETYFMYSASGVDCNS